MGIKDIKAATAPGITVRTVSGLLAAIAIGGQINVSAGTYALARNLAIPNANTTLNCEPYAVTFSFATVGATHSGFIQQADNFQIFGWPEIVGPAANTYVADECGIKSAGTSSADRLEGLRVDAIFRNWGGYCIFGKFLNNVSMYECRFYNYGYAGSAFFSCDHILATDPWYIDAGPGTSGNVYGFSASHITTDYDDDPDAGTQAAANPFCYDFMVLGGRGQNMAWAPFDAHGAINGHFLHIHTFNCKHGIHLSGSSGDAAGYAGWDNEVSHCVVDSRKADGSAGDYENLGIGINMAGGSVTKHLRPKATYNTIIGYGVVSGTGGTPSLGISNANGAIVTGNVFKLWGGVAVECDLSPDLVATSNTFQELKDGADTVARCFNHPNSAATPQRFVGNRISANGGTAAKEFLRTSSTTRPRLDGNDLGERTSAAVTTTVGANFVVGSDTVPTKTIDLGSGGGTTTLDLSEFAWGCPRILLFLTAGAAISITNMTGVPVGTRVMMMQLAGSSAITYTRGSAAMAGSATWVSTNYDTLEMLCIAVSGGTQWVEMSRAANG
jgi:hypothetical protein